MTTVKRNDSADLHVEKSDIKVMEDVGNIDGLDTIEDTKPGAFVWLCAAATAIGGMLFGCEYDLNPDSSSALLTKSKTTQVSSLAYSSYLEQTSVAERLQTPRRKPSRHSAPQVHLLEQSWPALLLTSTVGNLLSGSQASSSYVHELYVVLKIGITADNDLLDRPSVPSSKRRPSKSSKCALVASVLALELGLPA